MVNISSRVSKNKPTQDGRRNLSLWRRCLCRNGFYPFAVAPFVTVAWLLDAYCCTGCNFINVDVGFQPINEAWDNSSINLGLFFYQNKESNTDVDLIWMDKVHSTCHNFSPDFEDYFITGDKTWWISRLMAYISLGGGCMATFMIWLLTLTPLPTCIIWHGILLPSVLISFLASGSKFIFFDIELCRSALWLPEGSDVAYEAAKNCTLAKDGILSIAAVVIYALSTMLICLKAPTKRENRDFPAFVYNDVEANMEGLRTDDMDDSDSVSDDEDDKNRRKNLNLSKEHLLSDGDVSTNILSTNSYDLDDIRKKSDENEAIYCGIKPKKVCKEELESERLREAEMSVEYEDKDYAHIMGRNHGTKRVHLSEDTSDISYTKDTYSSPEAVDKNLDNSDIENSSCFGVPKIPGRKLSTSTVNAPSDEKDWYYRSDPKKKTASDENNECSPLTPCKEKILKSMPTVVTNNQKHRYDEDLIKKCVLNLTKSFDEDENKFQC